MPEPNRRRLTDERLAAIMAVEGHLRPDECALLHELAADAAAGCIVEIGSYRGKSTVALALGTQSARRLPVYAIEPHEPFRGVYGGTFGPPDRVAFFENLLRTGVVELVRLVNLPSRQAVIGWAAPIALLFIDGDHALAAVREDFLAWSPHLRRGGRVAFHDAAAAGSGPGRVVADAVESGAFAIRRQVDSIVVLEKQRA